MNFTDKMQLSDELTVAKVVVDADIFVELAFTNGTTGLAVRQDLVEDWQAVGDKMTKDTQADDFWAKYNKQKPFVQSFLPFMSYPYVEYDNYRVYSFSGKVFTFGNYPSYYSQYDLFFKQFKSFWKEGYKPKVDLYYYFYVEKLDLLLPIWTEDKAVIPKLNALLPEDFDTHYFRQQKQVVALWLSHGTTMSLNPYRIQEGNPELTLEYIIEFIKRFTSDFDRLAYLNFGEGFSPEEGSKYLELVSPNWLERTKRFSSIQIIVTVILTMITKRIIPKVLMI